MNIRTPFLSAANPLGGRWQQPIWLSLYTLTLISTVALFGGVLPLAQALLPVFCAVLLAFTPAPTRKGHPFVTWGLFMPAVLVLLWAGGQLLPLGGGNGYWRLVPNGAGTLTLSPWQTFNHLIYGMGYLAFGWSVYQAGRLMPTRILAVTTLVIAAACLYGLSVVANGNETVLWVEKRAYVGFLTGTFINKNSFATLAALGVLASLAMMLLRVGEISSRLTTRQRFKAFWLLVVVPGWPWLLVAGICFMALVLTGSRAGLLAGIFGILTLLAGVAGTRRAARWPLAIMLGLMSLLFIVVLGAVGQVVGRRLTNVQSDSDMRGTIYELTHLLIGDNLLTGTGLGTFQQAFSLVRDGELLKRLPALVEHAHNTYLELAVELGLPGLVLLGGAATVLLAILLHGVSTRRRAVIWPTLGLATVVTVGGHALADFSLSVPAVTLVALTFVMLGAAQAFAGTDSDSKTGSRPAAWQGLALKLAAVPLVAVAGWLSAAEYHAFKAEPGVVAMQSGEALRPSEIFPIQRELQACLAVRPGHGGCREGLAQSYLSLATAYGLQGPQRGVALVYLNLAQMSYSEALQQAPANPWAWYRMARMTAYLGDKAQASTYLANSLLTGPYEPKLAVVRVPFMLGMLPYAGKEDAALFGINATGVWQAQKWQTERLVKANPAVWPTFAAMLQAQQEPLPRWLKL